MKKNILIILTDQQRKDSLGCYGNDYAKTPCLDRFAKEAIRFNRTYVANPICMPNRHSFFSGRYPHNHGVYTNGLSLPDTGCNLPHYLKELGWQTASIGKIHFTPTDNDAPLDAGPESGNFWSDEHADYQFHGPYGGFQYIELTVGHDRQRGHYRKWFLENGGKDSMFEGISETGDRDCIAASIPERLHPSAFVGERTCRWLREMRDPSVPFFLVASFSDPHAPFNPPAETAAKFSMKEIKMPVGNEEDLQSRPDHYREHFRGEWHRSHITPERTTPNGYDEMTTRERIRNTYAMVHLIDKNVGRILDTLQELNLDEETIVLFTSDHGELLGDHGLWLKGPFYYEGLFNIPMLMKVPGIAAREENGLFSTVDIVPTLCELLNIPIPYYVDGISQAPRIQKPWIKIRDWCMAEYRNGFGSMDVASRAIITEKYKYVRYQTGERELTDLEKDPDEKCNVIHNAEYKEVCSELEQKMFEAILNTENKYPQQVSFA